MIFNDLQGDVGGPAIVDNKLLGVISFGPPVCGDLVMPTVFTKLGYYAKWINSFIKNVRIFLVQRFIN